MKHFNEIGITVGHCFPVKMRQMVTLLRQQRTPNAGSLKIDERIFSRKFDRITYRKVAKAFRAPALYSGLRILVVDSKVGQRWW